MELKDIEQLLENAKYKHLAEATLVSYRDNQLEKAGLALAEAHLKLCLVCERRLTFLKQEQEALENYVMTDKDRALIEQAIKKVEPVTRATAPLRTEIQRVASYFRDLLTAWNVLFAKKAMLGSGDGDEIWRYESQDGLMTAWAVLKREDKSLEVHFSSIELAWEGVRIRFRLGPFNKEVTLQREGDFKVVAKINIPHRERARNMADISIEIV